MAGEDKRYRVAARVNYDGSEYRIVTPWLADRERLERELALVEAAREEGGAEPFRRRWIMINKSFILSAEIEEATAEEAAELGGPPEHVIDEE